MGPNMAIPWSTRQKSTVKNVLSKYPADSSKCANAARDILPVAESVDSSSRPRLIKPKNPFARWLGAGMEWTHHVNVETCDHYVDALAGADGCPSANYLDKFFAYPDGLVIEDVDLSERTL
jgi:hypothetical protein